MEILNVYSKSQNNWTIRPGPVGSVGEANIQVRLRGNTPDSGIKFVKYSSGDNERKYGSMIQDGMSGYGPRVIDRKFGSRPQQKTSVGWRFQNIIPVDRSSTSVMASLGAYSWDNKRAQVLKAKVTGDKFLPTPGGYSVKNIEGLSRGGQVPRVVLSESGAAPLPSINANLTAPITESNELVVKTESDRPSGLRPPNGRF